MIKNSLRIAGSIYQGYFSKTLSTIRHLSLFETIDPQTLNSFWCSTVWKDIKRADNRVWLPESCCIHCENCQARRRRMTKKNLPAKGIFGNCVSRLRSSYLWSVFSEWIGTYSSESSYTQCVSTLKVPKREIFDRSDFPDFYTMKSLRVGIRNWCASWA